MSRAMVQQATCSTKLGAVLTLELLENMGPEDIKNTCKSCKEFKQFCCANKKEISQIILRKEHAEMRGHIKNVISILNDKYYVKDLSFILDIIFRLIEEGNTRKLKSILTLTQCVNSVCKRTNHTPIRHAFHQTNKNIDDVILTLLSFNPDLDSDIISEAFENTMISGKVLLKLLDYISADGLLKSNSEFLCGNIEPYTCSILYFFAQVQFPGKFENNEEDLKAIFEKITTKLKEKTGQLSPEQKEHIENIITTLVFFFRENNLPKPDWVEENIQKLNNIMYPPRGNGGSAKLSKTSKSKSNKGKGKKTIVIHK